MGNKIITEKDFWTCTMGAVPGQLQGSNETVKTPTGEKYITIRDTASSSWIDFGCTRAMLIYAAIAAAAVVVAALVVGTGGTALIALGAVAGLAGAAWGAVVGSLLCGQLAAKIRKWDTEGKQNFLIQGIPTITGDHKMICSIGGTVEYTPNIKSWSQALALATSNYVGKLMEGAMAGALIGTGGSFLSGGLSAFGSGGLTALRQAGISFARNIPSNFAKNLGQGFTNGIGFKIWDGIDNNLQTYGNTGETSFEDFKKGFKESTFGDINAIKNIINTGGGTVQDWLAVAILLTPADGGKRKGHQNNFADTTPNKKYTSDVDSPNRKKADTDTSVKPKNTNFESPETKKQNGEAFANDGDEVKLKPSKSQQQTIDDVNSGKILLEGYEGHKVGNHTRKSNYGEMNTDLKMESITEIDGKPAKLTALHEKVTDIDTPIKQGIDHIYQNTTPPPKYVIVESKYGSSKLNKKTGQMGNDWLEDRIKKQFGGKDPKK